MERGERITLPPEIWCHILSFIGEVTDITDEISLHNFFQRQNLILVNRLFNKEISPCKLTKEYFDFYDDIRIYKDSLVYLRKRDKIHGRPRLQSKSLYFHILGIGTSGCGRTSLLASYTRGSYAEQHESTIGGNFYTKKLIDPAGGITMAFWDIAGQSRYNYLSMHQYKSAHAVLLCFSVADRKSLISLFNYYVPELSYAYHRQIAEDCIQPVIYLVGLKSDLKHRRQVSNQEAKVIAQLLRLKYFECSAKLYQNVDEMMEELKNDLLKVRVADKNEPTLLPTLPNIHDNLNRGCNCSIQ